MAYYTVDEILKGKAPVGEPMSVRGWVRTRRDSKAGISFLTVYDGSCFAAVQGVVPNTLANYETQILQLTSGCSVEMTGTLVASAGQGQSYELQVTEVHVIGWVEDPETYPMAPKRHSMEYLREYAHLRPRTNIIGAIARVRHAAAQAIHRFFDEQGFLWVSTPIITSNDCEGAGEMFRVSTLDLMNLPKDHQGKIDFSKDFFGKETFLTVSGQLNGEAYCSALSKIYTFGPTFRAENSNTARHLAEFWMIEPEMAFADLMDVAKLAEALLKYVFADILARRSDDMAFFAEWIDKTCISRLEHILNSSFEMMTYTEAVKQLQACKQTFEYPVEWGMDLQTEHERYLTEQLLKRPVIITDYPARIKAFYMRMNEDNQTVAAMDVLVPGVGEIIGGSQREERLQQLDQRMRDSGLDPAHYGWYRDLRRYGSVPHGGFGLGFERLINYLSGAANIREVIPFPRTPKHAEY